MPQTFIAGVDIGASNLRVLIADEEGEIHARRSGPLPAGAPARVLHAVRGTVDDLARGIWSSARVGAIGVAMPGTVDPGRGLIASPANMPGWGAVDVAAALRGSPPAAVVTENDANAAAVGEGWLGAARGLDTFVFVALGTGIGTGLWLAGRLHRGAHFLAGEAAFFPMTRAQVRTPGWDACLESSVGGRAMEAHARRLLGGKVGAADLFEAARTGHAEAQAAIAEIQELLAMAVANMVALLDPQMVVFGGGVALAQGEALLDRVRALAHACTPAKPPIVLSTLGTDAQALGAVKLALDAMRTPS